MYQGLFLDDRQEEAHLASFLTVEGEPGLSTSFQQVDRPLEDMAGVVLERHPDLLALDYRLDDAQTPGVVEVRYKAGPLAQQLRDHASKLDFDDFPIVLVSHENIIQSYYQPDLTTHDLFDRIYAKEELVTDRERIGKELLALVSGYKEIISKWGEKARLARLLDLADEEGESLLGNQELRRWQGLKAPHQLAREILRSIIDRNGLLRNRLSLLARLGVAPGSPGIGDLINVLAKENVAYRGVFHGGWERWWDHRIEMFGTRLCGKELGSQTARERVGHWNSNFGLELVAAKSLWTGSDEMFPSFACASCGHPTEKIHSVATFDSAPSFVERRRICWDCVATGKYETQGLIIDDTENYIVEKIQNGEVQRET
jgi:hypothetical protein